MTLVGSTATWQSPQGQWLSLIYHEAFRRLGYDFRYINVPAKRASALSDSGEVDGEIHRVANYSVNHPDMVRVEQSHYSGRFVAYAVEPIVLAAGWDSLKGSGYRIEYRFGTEYSHAMLTTRVNPANLSAVITPEQGLQKLAFKRSDLYIDLSFNVDILLDDDRFRNAGIHQVATMEEVQGFSFLHKKHAALAPKLATVLAQMKNENLIELYHKQALQAWKVRQPQ